MNESTDNPGNDSARDLEEAIVPIRPGTPTRTQEPVAGFGGPPRYAIVSVASLILLVLLVGVFFVLPQWVDEPDTGPPAPSAGTAAGPVADEQPSAPALSQAELDALEESATDLLVEILELNEQLEARSADVWGGDEWVAYSETARAGDEAFLADEFLRANELYTETLERGRSLIDASDEIMSAAIEAGDAALAAGDSALAREQYGIVLTVDPENERAVRGITRAETLPEVLSLVREGDDLARSGDLAGARDTYQQALAIDPDWAPAARALSEVSTAIAGARFDNRLSDGYAALADQDYDRAEEAFTAALELRPSSAAALDGLAQAEQGKKLDSIALAEIRALAFERRELWDEAIARYEAALATDPTLAFAIDGLERSRARADLDAKLVNLIDNPRLLLNASMLADANVLLGQARQVPDPGERISAQASRLEVLINAATTPVTVQFESDQQTEVSVFRVGDLGAFLQKQIELRPGTYTVVGSRVGYRDVRTTVTVLPGRPVDTVRVVCVEPI